MRLTSLVTLAVFIGLAFLGRWATQPPASMMEDEAAAAAKAAEEEAAAEQVVDICSEPAPTTGVDIALRAGAETLILTPADRRGAAAQEADAGWGVTLTLCPRAARELAQLTQRRQGELLEILESGSRLAQALIREPIRGGRLTIALGLDQGQAETLAARLDRPKDDG